MRKMGKREKRSMDMLVVLSTASVLLAFLFVLLSSR